MGFAPGYIVGSAELPLTECESERQVSGIEGERGQESGGLRQEGVGSSLLGRSPCLAIMYCISQEWDLNSSSLMLLEVLEEWENRIGITEEPLAHASPCRGTPHTRGKMPVSIGPKTLPRTGLLTLLLEANPKTVIK